MTRASTDEIRAGRIHNGYDYRLQAWVSDGIIQGCNHPESMRRGGQPCCRQFELQGRSITEIEDAEQFPAGQTSRS